MVTIEELAFDIYDHDVIAHPHAFYARMRDEAPVLWSDQHRGWLLTRYEDVRTVLRDNERFSSVRSPAGGGAQSIARPDAHREEVAPPGTLTLLGADPPDHTRLRRLLDRDFTPGKIAALEPHVTVVADRLLEGAASRPTFDVMDELAVPVPVTVIAELLGIPPERGGDFKRWSDAATEPFRPDSTDEEIAARNQEIVEFRAYLQEQIAARHDNPTDDFIGRLVVAHDDEEKLTDDELLAAVNLLLLAGNETTTNLIGNGVLALLRNPDQMQILRDDPELIDNAIEEFLRYDGSVQYTSRVAMEDVEFHGQRIKQGENIVVVLASANRDEREIENGESFDIRRGRTRHFALGDWIHICLGQHLARLETRASIKALLREFPTLEMAVPDEELRYRANFNLRGLLHLPVRTAS